MNPEEPSLRDAVRKLAAEWNHVLHIAGGSYWKIEGVTDPRKFFSHLPIIFPFGMTLLVEGLEMGLTAKSLYEEYPAIYMEKISCDTFIPTPDSFHVAFSDEFAERLCRLIDSQGMEAAFYHFKGYSEREILFMFHDAFEGELILSNCLPERAVREFASSLGCSAERAEFGVDQRKDLERLDRAMNPPWWRRVLRFLWRKEGV